MDSEEAANVEGIEFSQHILDAGNMLLSMINTILELVDASGGDLKLNKTSFNTSDLINRVVKVLKPKADKSGVEILVKLKNTPKFVYADSHRLTQIIGNMLDNALRFSTEPGAVTINASGDDNNVTFIITDHGSRITDQGVGMTEDQLKIAEEPFR